MKTGKKTLSVLLALCMAFGLLTIHAGAWPMETYLPVADTWEDSQVLFTLWGTGEDIYFCMTDGPRDGTVYNVGITSGDQLVAWRTGLVQEETGILFHTRANVMYEFRASLKESGAPCYMAFEYSQAPNHTPEGLTWLEVRDDGPGGNPDYLYDLTRELPAADSWEDSMQLCTFSGDGSDLYIYALSGPEGGLYHIGCSITAPSISGRGDLLGWYPGLVAGQSGAVVHTQPNTYYELRASAAQSGEYRLIISRTPVDLTWADQVHPFTDVSTDAPETWEDFNLKNSILYVYANGWMTGTTSTTFSPNDYFTRAMLWTVLARMNNADTAGGDPWYEPARQWAMAAGISDGTFPDRNASLQEVITMLYNQAGRPAATTRKNIDADGQVAGWARDAMTWAYSECLIQGGDPAGAVTRAELAVILAEYAIVTAR